LNSDWIGGVSTGKRWEDGKRERRGTTYLSERAVRAGYERPLALGLTVRGLDVRLDDDLLALAVGHGVGLTLRKACGMLCQPAVRFGTRKSDLPLITAMR